MEAGLIIKETGESNCRNYKHINKHGKHLLGFIFGGICTSVQSSSCSKPTQLPQSSTAGTTESVEKRISTFFSDNMFTSGRVSLNGIMSLSVGSLTDNCKETLNSVHRFRNLVGNGTEIKVRYCVLVEVYRDRILFWLNPSKLLRVEQPAR